tara:strand:+ start:773 stop:1357 length:585 start_codon:yes stop_codon:yes gene_type:complete
MFFTALEGRFFIDKENSTFEWIGRKVSGEHNGNIKISSADLSVYKKTDDTFFISGYMSIDMNTISNIDIQDIGTRAYLVEHLKDDDFFNVINYPYSYIKIVDCTPLSNLNNNMNYNYLLNAEITIKGISKAIEFPILVEELGINKNEISAIGTIDIDRTDFGIKYKSKSYFPSIGDKFIYDDFTINFKISGEIK